jgi:hypothetical protein
MAKEIKRSAKFWWHTTMQLVNGWEIAISSLRDRPDLGVGRIRLTNIH